MSNQEEGVVAEEGAEAQPKKLDLQVKIDKKSACERHITVEIARDDIERYFENALKDLMPKAAVPGFRLGRAPARAVQAEPGSTGVSANPFPDSFFAARDAFPSGPDGVG